MEWRDINSAIKNAVYDWAHTFDTDDDGKVNVLDLSTAGRSIPMPVVLSALRRNYHHHVAERKMPILPLQGQHRARKHIPLSIVIHMFPMEM
jgi:hypothetical protein